MSNWQPMETAPRTVEYVQGKLKDGRIVEMHYACDLSGEEMPPFRGWFIDAGSYFKQVDPIAWQPKEKQEDEGSKQLQRLMNDIRKWSDAAFGYGQRNPYIARHLLEEVKELIEELEAGTDHGQRQEFADCFMLLLDSASHANITASQLIEEAYNKLEINKQREWGEPDENGIIEHKREGKDVR